MSRFLDGLVCLAVIGIALGVLTWVTVPVVKTFWMDEPIVQASNTEHPRSKTHQVISGDTLWTIALEYYPNVDPRDVVGELRKINSLASATIYPYQVLVLPEVE